MRLSRNLLAGLTNSIWSALVGLAVVPFYIKYLGIEAYGLIGFFAMTHALLQLLDFGLAPTINREVARCSASGSLHEARNLLHTLAVIYWCVGGLIALFAVMAAPLIAEYWLQSNHLPQQTVTIAVTLMGLIVACRWPIGLYSGALMGAQRISLSSVISIAMVTVGSVGAVGILAFVSPTIEAFFIWQAGVGLVYAAIMRWAAWRVVGRAGNVRFNVDELKRIWRFSASMSGIALTAIIFTQLDKIILSRILGLDEFGRYILATVVVNGLYILITPLFNVIYPLFSALIVNNNTEKLTNMYRLGTCMLATVLFPIAMVLAVFAEDLVHMWTGNPEIASSVAPIIAFLTIGSALHGVMYFPYALQLAYGQTRIPLMINAILMVVLVPLVISLALVYGALGGAIAWFVLQVLYVMLGTPMTHHRLLKGLGSRWLLQDVGVPLVLSLLAGLVGYYTLQGAQHSSSVRLMCGVVLALLASLFSLLASPKLRKVVLNNFGLKKQSEALFRRYD